MRYVRSFVLLVAAVSVVFCSGDGPSGPPITPPPITPPPPQQVVLVELAVLGDTVLVSSQDRQYRSVAKYSDGTTKEVTSETKWETSSYFVSDVTPQGMAIPARLGTFGVRGSYLGMSSSLRVRVAGTPWSTFQLSSAVRQGVMSHFPDSDGKIWRWSASAPILVWAHSGHPREDVLYGTRFWETVLEGKGLRLLVVEDSASADMWLTFDPSINDTPCGWEGPHVVINGVIVKARGRYVPGCTGKLAIVHGLGHMLGFSGHSPSGEDVMGYPEAPLRDSEHLRAVMRAVYSMPPRTIPIDG